MTRAGEASRLFFFVVVASGLTRFGAGLTGRSVSSQHATMSQFPNALKPSEEDIAKMLACQVHLGSRNSNTAMQTYIYKRRSDGVHIFDLNKTWAKVSLALLVFLSFASWWLRSCRLPLA